MTQKWNLDHPVIGVAWLEGPSLAVIQEQGTRTLIHLYNPQGQAYSCTSLLGLESLPEGHVASCTWRVFRNPCQRPSCQEAPASRAPENMSQHSESTS